MAFVQAEKHHRSCCCCRCSDPKLSGWPSVALRQAVLFILKSSHFSEYFSAELSSVCSETMPPYLLYFVTLIWSVHHSWFYLSSLTDLEVQPHIAKKPCPSLQPLQVSTLYIPWLLAHSVLGCWSLQHWYITLLLTPFRSTQTLSATPSLSDILNSRLKETMHIYILLTIINYK